MRNAFAAEIAELAIADPRVVLLSGDIGNRLFDKYRDRCPGRFFNCGVAEANMISVAAGLAMNGLKPVAYTITPFITTRCLEQIRVDCCYHDVPVTVVGTGAGLAYASLGPTHHSCEDIALLRALPNMAVVCPGDPVEVRLALQASIATRQSPTYIRLGKKGEAVVHSCVPTFEIGKAITMRPGRDVCLLSTGNMLPEALATADLIAKTGRSVQVASFHTVKPLDLDYLKSAFRNFALVATIEEHSRIGGFGSAVAEWLSDQPLQRAALLRFGSDDTFLHESGEQHHARHHFGITAQQMAETIASRLFVRTIAA
ncbi:MAG: transketolase C-terminal domain-containing protein [Gemmataceae bacterium]